MLHEATDLVGDAQGRHYSLDLDEYLPMCRSCHKRYDNGSLVLEELMTCG